MQIFCMGYVSVWVLYFSVFGINLMLYRRFIVDNKVKGRILKPVFQENKARQIFRKTNISCSLICTAPTLYLIKTSENLILNTDKYERENFIFKLNLWRDGKSERKICILKFVIHSKYSYFIWKQEIWGKKIVNW